MEYVIGDIVKLKKTHPCGGREWTILRTGADIKLKCNTCGRIIMLDYMDFTGQVIARNKDNAGERTDLL